ncbi:hypothetical protein [Hydrogenobaculum acidophilum]
MNKFEKKLEDAYCTKDEAILKYSNFRKSKIIITTESVKNLYYYADLFYKILVSTKYINTTDEEALKDMAKVLCYITISRSKIPFFDYIENYRLVKYVFKKHRDFIDSYLEANKLLLSAF